MGLIVKYPCITMSYTTANQPSHLLISTDAQEQAKKKARAERFGSSGEELAAGTKAVVPTSTKASNGVVKAVISEEEAAKRQARALRFATAPPASKAASSGTTAEQVQP